MIHIGRDAIYKLNGAPIAVTVIDRHIFDGKTVYSVKAKSAIVYYAKENELSEVKAHANNEV